MANECDSENYVAEIWRVLVSEATIPPLRIIIRAATYTQLCCMQHSWAHVRRDFITVGNERDEQEQWAEQWLADIAMLYRLHEERLKVRAEPVQYAAAEAALRAAVQAMQERRERELAQQPKLPAACAKVLRSLRNHWDGLTLFVADPGLPLDNNQAERALRGPVVGRKNYYGSGAQWSGELSATLFSLFQRSNGGRSTRVPG